MVRDARRDVVLRVLVWGKEEGGQRKSEAEKKRRALGENGDMMGKEKQRQVRTEQTAEVCGKIKHEQEDCSKKRDRKRAQELNRVSKLGWSAHVMLSETGVIGGVPALII